MSLSEIQIDSDALRYNVRSLRSLVGSGVKLIAVVKANAYGHGLATVVEALNGEVDGFQVDDIEELREIRQVTDRRVLVLGYVAREDIAEAASLGGELTLYDAERLPAMAEAGAKVHLKIDALLGRQGVLPRDLPEMLDALAAYPSIEVLTAYAHFANIEDTTDLVHAIDQMELFDCAFVAIRNRYPGLGRHISATSGVMTLEAGNDLVRLGIGTYGMYPSSALERQHAGLGLRPALRWVSRLAQVKTLPARHPVGYGLTYIAPREITIGIVPQGYGDGYDRGLSNVGEVLVRGRRCRVLGRVAMNMFAVDLSDADGARAEDEVVLLGAQGEDRISAEEIAIRIGTINYEVTTRISPLLPRRAA
ncbi:alanine racemase [Fimbriimonas ginsengisoli]|uniref:Alanine racemase n=1 Tax=Fimbriimonas ginsengisoli Gsoil 348 TaxID=661478 RepID=A0A068NXE5_FIMGI|nr:alanine racemase [Fimbriimonas ginsengisoli]AIE87445.1 alanine racemase [Fimbriimonas ginsengisoli Gsoil 348]